MIPSDLFDMIMSLLPLQSSGRLSGDTGKGLARTTPYIQGLYVLLSGKSPFFGGDLRPAEVSAFFMEYDHALTGGMLTGHGGVLGVVPATREDGEYWSDPVSGFNTTTYKATNTRTWWFLNNIVQLPGFGRSMGMYDAADKTDLGILEGGLHLLHKANKVIPFAPGRTEALYPTVNETLLGSFPQMAGPRPYVGAFGEGMAVFGLTPRVTYDPLWRKQLLQKKLRYQTSEIKKSLLVE